MGLAEVRSLREISIEAELSEALDLATPIAELKQATELELELKPMQDDRLRLSFLCKVQLKYRGTDTAIAVDFADRVAMVAQFEQLHRQRYGFIYRDTALMVEAIAIEAICLGEVSEAFDPACVDSAALLIEPQDSSSPLPNHRPTPIATVPMYVGGHWIDTPVFQRESLQAGDRITGAAIVIESTGTNVIEPGWSAIVTRSGDLILEKSLEKPSETTSEKALEITINSGLEPDPDQDFTFNSTIQNNLQTSPISPLVSTPETSKPDPVRLEIFNNLFRAIAEQMGITLQNTSTSVNIKERLDFSCAIFDRNAELVANAPHIPVHLGSMSESVQALVHDRGSELRSGDVYLSNNPYNGGTHLPDITVITPVFAEDSGELRNGDNFSQCHEPQTPLFYVASRGHHADIGGITPGSMPPNSRTIDDEGILFDNLPLVKQGEFLEAEIRDRLTQSDHPARNPDRNIADLRAQIAANTRGVRELRSMVNTYGLATVCAYMQHVQDNAEAAVRQAIASLTDGTACVELDSGDRIQVKITVNQRDRSAMIDFSGTSAQLASNFNAPAAVCKAAVLYVFRTLVDDDIPLNAGCLKPLSIVIPPGFTAQPHPTGCRRRR